MTREEDSLVVSGEPTRERPSPEDRPVSVGDWYWVRMDRGEWLGCVTHVGTNYASIWGPVDEHCCYSERVLLREVGERCRPEPRAEEVVAAKIAEQRATIADLVRQIGGVTSRLCLGGDAPGSDTRALATHDGSSMGSYGKALERAKKKTLPELQEKIEKAASIMRAWMQAGSAPVRGQLKAAKRALELVEDRISGVEIYAGLVEQLAQVRGGDPAAADQPLHLLQRRHYMDEECLARYECGGMRFGDLPAFEEWLLRPENLGRIMPHPRCALAFRVRRAHREQEDSVIEEFVRLLFDGRKDEDMRTYLYIRNGDRVYRLSTKIDFGERLFPDADHSILREGKLYAEMFGGSVERLATEGEYLEIVREWEEYERAYDAAPEDKKFYVNHPRYEPGRFVPWDDGSVYYDDVTAHVRKIMSDHNRLVLLLQGVLDRSEALLPHPSYQLWRPEDFARAVRLVHDQDRALTPGDEPDFEAYRAEVNRLHLRPGARTVGQQEVWLRIEAEKENTRLDRRYGYEKAYYMHHRRYQPDGDPGPGVVAVVQEVGRKGCSFRWRRDSRSRPYWNEEPPKVRQSIRVPSSELLCVDGYRPGDYRLFYDDPRTRAKYLKWAPLLLRAEEYHAGNSAGEGSRGEKLKWSPARGKKGGRDEG